ncbi:hypothetical protein BCR44DRAFT_1423228 [Catenaria anguillulae PL171]|uniref:RRM domain-containing protein n=1 Tax=Catenaria anguillulae PL171 TaxID=765915 RepID=A0A1Y2I434_9FUNG|nr:hypothetical protein BCR44DRAFT_1423228 [Catenaria anguillulae PL171]
MHPDELDAPETMVQTAQRALKDSTIKCRFCGGPHWSKECPSKDIIQSLQEATQGASDDGPSSSSGLGAGSAAGAGGSRYVPPSVRAAMAAGGSAADAEAAGGRMMPRRMDDSFPVRIANLPEEMSDQDLVDLAQPFGRIARSYLAKHDDGTCKGFAFVNFSTYTEAEAAVSRLNGYGYANLILTCEHSKPRPPK